jgi:Icc protein
MTSSNAISHIEDHQGTVRLVQITDAHLSENPGGTLLGMDTDHSLQMVLKKARDEVGRSDVLLLTGDLSDGGSDAAYTRMDSYSRQLSDNCFWLPGNHDDRELMACVLEGSNCLSSEIRIANWQILMLDSQLPGKVGGSLGADQLSLLESALGHAQSEGLNTLVCLHHHPIKIDCGWLDEQVVEDATEFFDILDAHSGVKAVLWGHIHQEVDVLRNGVALLGSPSTCVQFAPGTELFKADDLAPGYRWLNLYPDGSIETGVSRVEGVDFIVDLDSKGYA